MTSPTTARACSRCRGENDRAPQRYCRRCHNAANQDYRARTRKALRICKKAGLTVVASESGFASAPAIKSVPRETLDAEPVVKAGSAE